MGEARKQQINKRKSYQKVTASEVEIKTSVQNSQLEGRFVSMVQKVNPRDKIMPSVLGLLNHCGTLCLLTGLHPNEDAKELHLHVCVTAFKTTTCFKDSQLLDYVRRWMKLVKVSLD